jgi:hypothetical protein
VFCVDQASLSVFMSGDAEVSDNAADLSAAVACVGCGMFVHKTPLPRSMPPPPEETASEEPYDEPYEPPDYPFGGYSEHSLRLQPLLLVRAPAAPR